MPGKGAKEKTYTTLSEVGNVLDDLLQKFASFTTNQDRIPGTYDYKVVQDYFYFNTVEIL